MLKPLLFYQKSVIHRPPLSVAWQTKGKKRAIFSCKAISHEKIGPRRSDGPAGGDPGAEPGATPGLETAGDTAAAAGRPGAAEGERGVTGMAAPMQEQAEAVAGRPAPLQVPLCTPV